MGGTVHELAWQPATREDPFPTAHKFTRFAGCFSGLRRQQGLANDSLGHGRVGLKKLGQSLIDDPGGNPLNLTIAQLGLGWLSNCGSGTRTLMIAVRPSLKSSPVIVRSLFFAGAAVLAYWFSVRE